MLRSDLFESLVKRSLFLILICLTVIVGCRQADAMIQSLITQGILTGRTTAGDLLCYVMLGANKPISGQIETPPFLVMALQMLPAAMIAGIVRGDLLNYGSMKIVYCGNRRRYSNMKLLWVVLQMTAVWIAAGMTILLYAGVKGYAYSLRLTKEIWMLYGASSPSQLTVLHSLPVLIVLPIMTSLAIAFMQVLIELIYGTVAGFASVYVLLLLSINCQTPLLICNYLMLIRSEILMTGGMNAASGILLTGLLIVAESILIRYRIVHVDVLAKDHVM